MPTEEVILSAKTLALCRLSGMALFLRTCRAFFKRVPRVLKRKDLVNS
jgi:hypothetical protein